jgi:hypothetical protein
MKKLPFFIVIFMLNSSLLFSQVAINTDGSAPDASAALDLAFTNKGFLPPRLSQAQIIALPAPADGLIVYCTTDKKVYLFDGSTNAWKEIMIGSGLILPPFTCGMPYTVQHTAGTVAPVSKTVTYGTVMADLTYSDKCWITQNLGADHQATAKDDATEPSAGWYWQFNRIQGFKHDGTNRTPNTTWITSIIEDSEWLAANDPCALLLGNGWRMPTRMEWYNMVYGGSWTDWNGPWNSALKLHAAGHIFYDDGSLRYRGSSGYYWSGKQSNGGSGRFLWFRIDLCFTYFDYKSNGFSIRCIQDSPNPGLPTVNTTVVTNITEITASSGGDINYDGGDFITTRGVCWSTSPNPEVTGSHTTNGSGTGEFTSSITGLDPNTLYYLRAYATNSIGTGYGNEVSFTTLALWTCSDSLTKNHVAGTVAPVNKTVTYGTASNIPGEQSKCWITQNLGADHQATAVDDATEPSAGWYWQFNRMQGYKHDGTTVTPAWTITSIIEDSDWLAANDPCALLLGSHWRIPTSTEWNNLIAGGNWQTSWDDPWNSALKLHAAGIISNGMLYFKGESGWISSTTQWMTMTAKYLHISINGCSISDCDKTNGFSVRCLSDSQTPDLPTVTTTAATNITLTTATSGGNVTFGGGADVTARGVCWSTSSNPTIADSHSTDGSGTGVFVSSLTDLADNTLYYARAYATNVYGTVYGNEVSFNTLSWSCGISNTIYHVAGDVAPVNKTVTYGTVTNIPGEPSKCWITQNLGADHQATAVDDATEPSAGWYWQFNRMQGYKHDGSIQTPNTTWITGINENSDWLTANDPCTIELGGAWRIPTYTELYNVDASGGWTDWNGAWNSALKLHAPGFISSSGLAQRGAAGYYWSCNQNDALSGWDLTIYNENSIMSSHVKDDGFSVRCIRE